MHNDWSVKNFPTTSLADGRYEVLKELGRGAQGRTFLGLEVAAGRRVAIKELDFGQIDRFKAFELFEREARVLAELDIPWVPRYLDYFSEEDAAGRLVGYYLVQEYIEGETLQQMADAGRLFTEDEVLTFLEQMLDILENLHSRQPQVIHRDVKPSNIIWRARDERYFLVDFGAVYEKVVRDSGSSTVIGTSGYAPLEQLMGRALPASDLYALGATAIYLLSGIAPVELYGVGHRLDFHDRIRVSAEFVNLLERMCAPEVEDRFKSGELAKYVLKPIIARNDARDKAAEEALKKSERLELVRQAFERWPSAAELASAESHHDQITFSDLRAVVKERTRAGTAEIFEGGRGGWYPAYAVAARSTAVGPAQVPMRVYSKVSVVDGVLTIRMLRRPIHIFFHTLGAMVLMPVGLGSLIGVPIAAFVIGDVRMGISLCLLAFTIGLALAFLALLQFRTLLAFYFVPRLTVDDSTLRYSHCERGWPTRVEVKRSEIESVGVIMVRIPTRTRHPDRGVYNDYTEGHNITSLTEITLVSGERIAVKWPTAWEEGFYLMGELYHFLESSVSNASK